MSSFLSIFRRGGSGRGSRRASAGQPAQEEFAGDLASWEAELAVGRPSQTDEGWDGPARSRLADDDLEVQAWPGEPVDETWPEDSGNEIEAEVSAARIWPEDDADGTAADAAPEVEVEVEVEADADDDAADDASPAWFIDFVETVAEEVEAAEAPRARDTAPTPRAAGTSERFFARVGQGDVADADLEDNHQNPEAEQDALAADGTEVQDMVISDFDEEDAGGGGDDVSSMGAGPSFSVMRKKELIDAVAAASGQRKSVVKPVVDAVLTELGAALARGEALVVQPLGKMSVARTRDRGGAEVLTIKLRRSKPAEATGEAQTEPAE